MAASWSGNRDPGVRWGEIIGGLWAQIRHRRRRATHAWSRSRRVRRWPARQAQPDAVRRAGERRRDLPRIGAPANACRPCPRRRAAPSALPPRLDSTEPNDLLRTPSPDCRAPPGRRRAAPVPGQQTPRRRNRPSAMTLAYIVMATLAGGLLSVLIAASLTVVMLGSLVRHLVSLSAGVLLGTALLNVLPEAFESGRRRSRCLAPCWSACCSSSCWKRQSSTATSTTTRATATTTTTASTRSRPVAAAGACCWATASTTSATA